MAPAPSLSSTVDVAGNRTFTHHESPVSSLHRTAEASIAVEGLRNTYIITVPDRRVLPPSLSGSKHRWWEGLRNTSIDKSYSSSHRGPHSIAHRGSKHRQWRASFTHRSPHSIAHSGSKRRQWRARRSSRCRITSVDASYGTHTSLKWLGVLHLLTVDHVCRPPGRTCLESSGGYSYFA